MASMRDGLVRDVQLFEEQAQVFERARNHPVGDLFGADFEEEGQAHCATSAAAHPTAAGRPRPAATPTAILRTRWITPTRSVTLMAPRASRVLKRLRAFQHLVVGGQQREAVLFGRFRVVEPRAGARLRLRASQKASRASAMSAISKL